MPSPLPSDAAQLSFASLGVILSFSALISSVALVPPSLTAGDPSHAPDNTWPQQRSAYFGAASERPIHGFGILSGYCERKQIDAPQQPGEDSEHMPGRIAPAAGTLIGLIFGVELDRALDEKDRYCAGRTLDLSADGNNVEWSSPEQGLAYTFTPLRTFRSNGGLVCREFWAALHNAEFREQVIRIACRQPSGHWLIRS